MLPPFEELENSRRVEVPGIYNMRDVGGLPTADGSLVRRGLFFRADNLGWLGGAGVRRFAELGVATVVDLRMAHEIAEYPSPFAGGSRPSYHNVDLAGAVVPENPNEAGRSWYYAELPDGSIAFPVYARVRDYCLWLESRGAQVAQIMSILAAPEATPAVFHCAGGKDRTGVVAALLQALAGVPDSLIAADYSHTAVNNFPRYRTAPWRIASVKNAADYRREFCAPDVMLSVLFWLRSRFGDIGAYLDWVGLERTASQTLKDRLSC
jgi:protein-tyrosine phosphatase